MQSIITVLKKEHQNGKKVHQLFQELKMKWWKIIEEALYTYLGEESPDFDMFKKKK